MTFGKSLRKLQPRSWLFVPALRSHDWLPKAIATGADAVILDLEDATAPTERTRARESIRTLSIPGSDRPAILVRVNNVPEHLEDDLAAAVALGADGIVVPRVDCAGDIGDISALLELAERRGMRQEPLPIVAMIETPRAVLSALEIADAHERIAGLAFGAGDLAAHLGVARSTNGSETALARATIALAAAAAGVSAIDTPFLDIENIDGLRAEAHEAFQLGFVGKLVIHPSHVPVVNEAFMPSDQEIAHARGVLEAFERAILEGIGVTRYAGRMIDSPDAAQARRVLERARHSR